MYTILNFYHFISFKDIAKVRYNLLEKLIQLNLKGAILLSQEGINGGIAGSQKDIGKFKEFLQDIMKEDFLYFISSSYTAPFTKQSVKVKSEIIKMNRCCTPKSKFGKYLSPKEWHQFIKRSDTIVFDTRNADETRMGLFKGSAVPNIRCFSEFPKYFASLNIDKNAFIGMYCTGGIRCEKTTSLIIEEMGFKNVFHLRGGILAYLKEIPAQDSLWTGECYVFDRRISIRSDLSQGTYIQCFACRRRLSLKEQDHSDYKLGISCQHCLHEDSVNTAKFTFREWQKKNDRA